MYCQFTMQCFSILARTCQMLLDFPIQKSFQKRSKGRFLARSVRPPCTRNTRTTMDISSSENEHQQSSSTAPQPAVEAAPDGVFLPDANPARAHNTADASASSREKKCRKDKSTYCMHPGYAVCGPALVGKPRKKKCQNLPCPDGKVRDLPVAPMNAAS